jgi:hypothetical protein
MNRPWYSRPILVEKSQSLESEINDFCRQEQSPIRRNGKKKHCKEKLPLSPIPDTSCCQSPSILKRKYFSPAKIDTIDLCCSDDEESNASSRVCFVGGDVSETRLYDPKKSPVSVCPPMPILFSTTANRRRSLELYSGLMISTTANRRRSVELYSSLMMTSTMPRARGIIQRQRNSMLQEVAVTIIQARFRAWQQYRHYQANKAALQIERTQMIQIVMLENELQRILTRHADELELIEQHKQTEMSRIYNEVMQEFQQEGRRKDAILEENISMIKELRLENKKIRKRNQVIQVENLEMAQRNERLLKMIDQMHESIIMAEGSNAIFESDCRQIQEINNAWDQRIRQFQKTSNDIEDHLHAELMIHRSTVRTIRSILRHINQTCPDKQLAKSIIDQAKTSMESIAIDRSQTKSPYRV